MSNNLREFLGKLSVKFFISHCESFIIPPQGVEYCFLDSDDTDVHGVKRLPSFFH